MDFNIFDSRAGGDKAALCELDHPGTGERMEVDGKPAGVYVLGIEGAMGQSISLAAERAKIKGSETSEQTIERMVKETAPLIVGFTENILRGDRPARAPDDVEWFLRLQTINGRPGQRSFLEQVRAFSVDRRNFLGNVSPA